MAVEFCLLASEDDNSTRSLSESLKHDSTFLKKADL
jgi:hypothetical protein